MKYAIGNYDVVFAGKTDDGHVHLTEDGEKATLFDTKESAQEMINWLTVNRKLFDMVILNVFESESEQRNWFNSLSD